MLGYSLPGIRSDTLFHNRSVSVLPPGLQVGFHTGLRSVLPVPLIDRHHLEGVWQAQHVEVLWWMEQSKTWLKTVTGSQVASIWHKLGPAILNLFVIFSFFNLIIKKESGFNTITLVTCHEVRMLQQFLYSVTRSDTTTDTPSGGRE